MLYTVCFAFCKYLGKMKKRINDKLFGNAHLEVEYKSMGDRVNIFRYSGIEKRSALRSE